MRLRIGVMALLTAMSLAQTGWAQLQQLQQAIDRDDGSAVGALVKSDPNLIKRPIDNRRRVALEYAIDNGKAKAVTALLNEKADDQFKNSTEQTPLHLALAKGQNAIGKILLEHGADVNATDRSGLTPLMYISVHRGTEPEWVDILIKQGAQIDATKDNGQSALHLACYYNRPRVAKRLIEAGARLDATDNNQNTPLLAACMSCPEAISDLLAAKADPLAVNRQQQTALHLACLSSQLSAVESVIEFFPSVQLLDAAQRTPLSLAVQRNAVDVVRLLLKRDADPNFAGAVNNRPVQPLVCQAVANRSSEILQLLLDHGAKPDSVGAAGNAPLHLVMEAAGQASFSVSPGGNGRGSLASYQQMIDSLLQNNANPNLKNQAGKTPLQLAVENNFPAGVEALIEVTQELNFELSGRRFLHWAAQHNLPRAIERIARQPDVDIELQDSQGQRPLHVAASNGNAAGIKALLDLGAAVNTVDGQGMTPLLLAANSGDANAIDLLLSRGADVTARDTSGQHALHLAAWAGAAMGLRRLCEELDDPNVTTESGYTPLHAAAWQGHLEAAQQLVQAGADVNRADSDGWAPLHKAAFKGHVNLVQWLLANGADPTQKNQLGMTARQLADPKNEALQALFQ